MIKSTFARQASAILASVVATTLCLSAAIGPAQPGTGQAVSTLAARVLA